MANDYFNFKQFTIQQGRSSFRVGTDAVILGAAAHVLNVKSILDIGAGTGVITLMMAQRSNAFITAIEPVPGSFSDLELNVASSPWSDRIRIFNTDLQGFSTEQKFDLIIANPPYFSNSLRNPDPQKSGTRHKDLLSDNDLLSGVTRLIGNDGIFQVILPKTEGSIFVTQALKYGLFCNEILKIRPLPSSVFSRLVLTFGREKLSLIEKELTIGTGQRHHYTQEYIALTKDFYLKF